MSSMYPTLLPIYSPCFPSLPLAIPLLVLVTTSPSAKMAKSSSRPQLQGAVLASSWAAHCLHSMHHKLHVLLPPHSLSSCGMSSSTIGRYAVEHAVQHVEGLTIDTKACPQHHCPACIAGKRHRDPFPASSSCASHHLELVSGPARVPGLVVLLQMTSPTGTASSWSPISVRGLF